MRGVAAACDINDVSTQEAKFQEDFITIARQKPLFDDIFSVIL
jgi:hypothetical protein